MKNAKVAWHRGETRWALVGLGLICAVAAAVLKIKSDEVWWMIAGVAALGFFGTEGIYELNRRRDVTEERKTVWRLADVDPEQAGPQRFRRVGECTPEQLGARRPLVEVPYQNRPQIEADIRAGLMERRPVLVTGPSMIGKSRVVAEVLRADYPDRPCGGLTLLRGSLPSSTREPPRGS